MLDKNTNYGFFIRKLFFPTVVILPPVFIALTTHNLKKLVEVTGSYPGVFVQYIFPVVLAYSARKFCLKTFGNFENSYSSPFQGRFWFIFILGWAVPEEKRTTSLFKSNAIKLHTSSLKSAPRGRNWIWVGDLHQETVAGDIIKHFKQTFPNSDILAFDLKSKSLKKSFKVGSLKITTDDMLNPLSWPENISVKPFRSLRKTKGTEPADD
ncbi:hypothetical protein HHI36_018375 [Cryptolaemus montrouzieri]|uniref:Uncharacterized protein n=1 Tax=Cryptolaemus montrouzieri TaxID=559131 RepID=A0ABD2P061_9CUCU